MIYELDRSVYLCGLIKVYYIPKFVFTSWQKKNNIYTNNIMITDLFKLFNVHLEQKN